MTTTMAEGRHWSYRSDQRQQKEQPTATMETGTRRLKVQATSDREHGWGR